VALRLKRGGITRVRPLAGGFEGWMKQSYPVRELAAPVIPALEGSRE
jgi:3-mercaptopyruvate sulfurtransferase SseA